MWIISKVLPHLCKRKRTNMLLFTWDVSGKAHNKVSTVVTSGEKRGLGK